MTPTSSTRPESADDRSASVDLYWLPLGAGASRLVRWTGRLYEAHAARRDGRPACALYHSALEVLVNGDRFAIEMTPVWGNREPERGVVCEGPVGLRLLGRSRMFRYEVRCWRNGSIPDVSAAVESPLRLSEDSDRAQRVLALLPSFPTATWGRDESQTGDMWNSNSMVAWLLVLSGHDVDQVCLPHRGRAPGWSAGLVAAERAARPLAGAR
jgi:hypothetical protein